MSGQTRKERRHRNGRSRRGRHPGGVQRAGADASSSATPGGCRVNLRRRFRAGAWNVRTLREDFAICQLSAELSRLHVSVAALSEVRRPGTGQISVGGYTYFWSGSSLGRHTEGVAIAVADALLPAIDNIRYHSERMMSLRLRHTLGALVVVSVYAPTDKRRNDHITDQFYRRLTSVVEACSARETPLVLGDLNAAVGTSRAGYEGVMGPHGSGVRVAGGNGQRLLEFAKNNSLLVAGTWFQRPESRRWTCYCNAGSGKSEIDHVLVGTRWRLLRNCRVFPSAQFHTDHRLLVAELELKIRSPRPRSRSSAFNVDKLRDRETRIEFCRRLSGSGDPGRETCGDWEALRNRLTSAARQTLGVAAPGRRRRTLPPDVADLVNRRRHARLAGDYSLYRSLRGEVTRALKDAEEARVREVCGRVSSHMFTCNSGPAFKAISALCGKQRPTPPSAILSADGSVLEGSDALRRFARYFEELLDVLPPRRGVDMTGMSPLIADPPINTQPPTLTEVEAALTRLPSGKAAGVCGIQAELLKMGGGTVLRELAAVFQSVWTSCAIPADWRRSIIVPIYKGRGERRDCGNYRGISLLSVPGKLFARIILDRIRPHLIKHQRAEQSGFTPKKSTVDRILALRVLVERRREYDKPFYAAFVDFRKAFDSVHRGALWDLLRLRGIPAEILRLIRALYTDTESAVRWGGDTSEYFPVNAGVRQGCVLAPSLFSACMDHVMERAIGRGIGGVSFANERFTDLDFADDAVIFAETESGLAAFLGALGQEAESLGLRVSWAKTKIMRFARDTVDQPCSVAAGTGELVEVVDVFPYLGARVTPDGTSLREVDRRLGLGWGVMFSLGDRIWRSRYLSRRIKVGVFRQLVLPVLLYGCEAWTLTSSLRSRLDSFGTGSLRKILGYRWFDFVSNRRLLRETGMTNISRLVLERQLSMFGHVARLPEGDPVHRIIACVDPTGWTRKRGRPLHTWLRQIAQYFMRARADRSLAWSLAMEDRDAYRRLAADVAKHQPDARSPK